MYEIYGSFFLIQPLQNGERVYRDLAYILHSLLARLKVTTARCIMIEEIRDIC